MSDSVTPWTIAHQASLSITKSWTLLELRSIESVMPPNHSYPLSSLSPPTFNLFQYQALFQCIKWAKFWSFGFSISPFTEYLGLISFRTDWLGLLAVQRSHKSLLQHHSSKASILRHSAFFIVQLSHT